MIDIDFLKIPQSYHKYIPNDEIQQYYEDTSKQRLPQINRVTTRAMAAKQSKTELNQQSLPIYEPLKPYLFEPEESKLFYDNQDQSSLQILYTEQQRIYKNLISYIQTQQQNYYNRSTFMDIHLYQLALSRKLKINQEGLIVNENNRYLVPPKLRISIMHYYHTQPVNYHRNSRVLYNHLNKKFYWKNMNKDIEIYVNQCLCNLVKYPHRQKIGFKDIGYESVYFISEPNEIIFMDLHGPMPDGNYICLMVDGFDGYTVITPLLPNYGLTALGIIKCVLFR